MGLILLAAGGGAAMAPETMAEFTRVFDPSLPQETRQQAMAAAFFAPGNDATVCKGGSHFATRRPNGRLVASPTMGQAILPEQQEAKAAAALDFLKSVR